MQVIAGSLDNSFNRKMSSLASILVIICIFSKLINAVIGMYTSLPAGLITMGTGWLMLIFYCVRYHNRRKLGISKGGLYLIVLVGVFFIVSNTISSGYCHELTLSFIEYGLFGFIVGTIDFDSKKVTKYASICVLVLAIPIYTGITQDIENTRNQTVLMGLVYAVLPTTFVTIISYLHFRRRRFYDLLSFVFSVSVLFIVAARGTRGAILCICTFILFLSLQRIKTKSTKASIIIIVSSLIIIILVNAETFLMTCSDILSSMRVDVNVVTKSLRLLAKSDDITNGRSAIYRYAIEGFTKSPIIGNGIGSFSDMYPSMKYPHNVFLQALFEGGIVLAIPITYALYRCIRYTVTSEESNKDMHALITALMACTLPTVMVTGEFWEYPILWLLFGCIIGRGSFSGRKTAS